jgi:hypothetical protein
MTPETILADLLASGIEPCVTPTKPASWCPPESYRHHSALPC